MTARDIAAILFSLVLLFTDNEGLFQKGKVRRRERGRERRESVTIRDNGKLITEEKRNGLFVCSSGE